jgi:diguanylate cyclase (GGDEF)-like protein
LLLLAVALPLGGAATMLISQETAKIALTEREVNGLGFTRRTVEVVRALRALRDRMELDANVGLLERRDVDSALGALYVYNDDAGSSLELTKRLARLAGAWQRVPESADGGKGVEVALQRALEVFDVIDDRSDLTADADGATADLIDAYGAQLPTITLQADTAKLLLVRQGGAGGFASRIRAAMALGNARRAYEMTARDVASAAKTSVISPGISVSLVAINASLERFVALADDQVRGAALERLRAQGRDDGDRTLDAVYKTQGELASALRLRLAEREGRERRNLALLRIETLLAFAVTIGFAVLLGKIIRDRDRRELSRARAEADRLASELDRQRRLDALSVTEAQLRAVFDRSSIGVAILDGEGLVLRSNRALTDMLTSIDARRIGVGHPEFRRLIAGEVESFVTELESTPVAGDPPSWFEATVSLVRDDAGEPRFAISMVKDVTERKRIDDQLRYDASHDPLTGLPNRTFFQERLRSTYFSDGGSGRGVGAVLFVDLDEFKFVNDSLGHGTGDRVLVAAGERLRTATSANDCIARFGGDEFAILLPGRESRDEIHELVDAIGRALAEPLLLDGQEVVITASIGVAIIHEYYHSVEEVLRDADTAMYFAKSAGRARSAVFNSSMHDNASRRLELATQLRRALEREQLYPAYQPVVSLASGRIESFEVLLRWEHPEIGPISPVEFIPVAEEIGLIVPIGRYVLEKALAQFAEWKKADPLYRPRRISVNASVREIVQTDYVEHVESAVRRYGLLPGELILEVTESAILSSGKFSFGTLERLKAIGVGLAIDDFGTGYSSLRYLQQFPFDELKIDRSFVGGADGRLASEPIVSMLINLSKAVGVHIVAEGVETAAQAARLRSLGATYAQGYLYGAAVKAQHVPALFRDVEKLATSA